jgi:N-acyl-L-homoserine lactone synthetase
MVALAFAPEPVGPAPSLSDRVMKLLERVDFRLADAPDEREAIFRLRYWAYLRAGAIPPNPSERFADQFDDMSNAWIFGVYIDGELASSIRLHAATKTHPELPALGVFADLLAPEISRGKIVVDPTRFVADRAASRRHPELCYVTTRLAVLASEYFRANLLLATVRAEHQAFYRRVFGHRLICEPRPYPSLSKPISLMALDYPMARERLWQRHVFLRSTVFERRMLFGRPVQGTPALRRPAA